MNEGFSIFISKGTISIENFISKKYDSFHLEEKHLEIVLEGVVLNKNKLLREYALQDFSTLILERYAQVKERLIGELEGEFRGYIYDKIRNKVFVFTNATSTQRVFYGKFGDQLFIDTHLIRLNENLKKNNIQCVPNIDAVYQLLALTGMLENFTILENVFKLLDGCYLEIDLDTSTIKEIRYFEFFSAPYFSKTQEDALRTIHDIFTDSVLMEYEKDEELGTKSLALLSGGLDSRIAMMYALQNGKRPENVLCFSQSGYLDETISRKIAEDYQLHYEFIPLDGGGFLKKIDQLTAISEGLVLYTGGIHVQHAMDHLQYQNFSLFHSGQIGDGILGGFNALPQREKPSTFKIVYNEKFFPKIETTFKKAKENYDTHETFLIRNLAFNRVLLGAHVFQQKAVQTSPFMTKEFLKLAISLPENWKYKHSFYLQWIKKYCPEATRYTWERTLMKPNADWKTKFGDTFLKPLFTKVNEKILKNPQSVSMYPYEYYFAQSEELKNYYHQYFQENIERLSSYPELKKDLESLFQEKTFYAKAQAVNILALFKLYF